MKALLLVSELEDYTISFANGVARHIPVMLGVPRRRYAHLVRWLDPAVDVRLLDWPRHRSPANLEFLLSLTSWIRRERPSLVHLLSNTTLWLNFAAPFWRPIPLITTVHDVQVHPGDWDTRVLPSWATTWIVRQSGHVIVHGESLREPAINRFDKLPDHVHVLSHPAIARYADLARASGLARRSGDNGFTVLLFGRIYAYKGLEHLVRAEAALGRRIPGLRIVIAGRGDDPWMHRHLMDDPDRYEVINRFIEDAEVAQLFLDADVVVLPYAEASQSGVLNLAAAFGKPVVVTDVGELRATVEPWQMGLVVPPNDAAALADAIARLAGDSDRRCDLGANALAWAEGPNAPEAVGARAVELYRRIASQS
jgi:glycosyltransferase involved in cell wall biosynthesis